VRYRVLGRTNLQISELSFGAGPVSTLMVGDDETQQAQTIAHALDVGINWFDTAATYGGGRSEANLGRALEHVDVHLATKARLSEKDLGDIPTAVRRSFESSLTRLRRTRVTLLQLHNSITARRGDEPTSITPADVLGPRGVLETFRQLRDEGLVAHLGLTGIGQPAALAEVIRSGEFDTLQVPYHLLNPSAGRAMPDGWSETDLGNIIGECARAEMGVLAIRVLAGGALADNPPSPHTLKTPFFPLDLYERDRARAAVLRSRLPERRMLTREAVRFALAHPHIQSALIGFGSPGQIDEAVEAMNDETPTDWDALIENV
jgi:D-threo-aldose 1-dehydrogenase